MLTTLTGRYCLTFQVTGDNSSTITGGPERPGSISCCPIKNPRTSCCVFRYRSKKIQRVHPGLPLPAPADLGVANYGINFRVGGCDFAFLALLAVGRALRGDRCPALPVSPYMTDSGRQAQLIPPIHSHVVTTTTPEKPWLLESSTTPETMLPTTAGVTGG